MTIPLELHGVIVLKDGGKVRVNVGSAPGDPVFTVDDLLEALRGKDVFELSDVAFAIVETNGSVSVLKKFPRDTPCNKDLHIEPPTAKQPSLPLLVDGVLNPVNMRLYSVDADWIDAQCRNAGLARKDVLLFLCNDAKETSIVKKESR